MESISRDFTTSDRLICAAMKFGCLDRFGSTFNFLLQHSDQYQTNFGAFLTILWLGLIGTAFAFYIDKWADMGNPIVSSNNYHSKNAAAYDLVTEEFNIYFIGINKDTGNPFTWDDFWRSYNLNATTIYFSPANTLKSDL
jgi:hypothetical protein